MKPDIVKHNEIGMDDFGREGDTSSETHFPNVFEIPSNFYGSRREICLLNIAFCCGQILGEFFVK